MKRTCHSSEDDLKTSNDDQMRILLCDDDNDFEQNIRGSQNIPIKNDCLSHDDSFEEAENFTPRSLLREAIRNSLLPSLKSTSIVHPDRKNIEADCNRIDEVIGKRCVENYFFGVKVLFPFEPYQSQMAMMSTIITALNSLSDGHALIESPTGTGKTMSLLCASIAWQIDQRDKQMENLTQLKYEDKNLVKGEDKKSDYQKVPKIPKATVPKIYYTSRTHKQLSQVN